MASQAGKVRIYARVSGDLAARIARGEFAIGARLPAERDLAQAYGVSRPTIREAVIALEVDGLVEVRQGSGVYVTARQPDAGHARETDIGPFELLEARRAIEAEVCALAALHITDGEIAALTELLDEMENDNLHDDISRAEKADHRFHLLIADASRNSAMAAVVELLWKARSRSPQSRLLKRKAHKAGVKPTVEEHRAIVAALAAHDPEAARAAMRAHLGRVLEALLRITEVEELEQARERAAAQRRRYAPAG
ncbi:FadR/GntR family transcriptional regulator [Sphingomonas sp.]|uniref:FadR/GntR family transcriptional regulator n=1 Tax=Sphingomonas sp. TaxID=28214 RepID=UPI000DB89DDA|nr:FadR/GntR family transcriptional regulator [Sphingomonas sp.]PZU09750.1 MAG: GntR family transcriptional regulator [Sphingomonas sp.]